MLYLRDEERAPLGSRRNGKRLTARTEFRSIAGPRLVPPRLLAEVDRHRHRQVGGTADEKHSNERVRPRGKAVGVVREMQLADHTVVRHVDIRSGRLQDTIDVQLEPGG